MVVIKRDRSNNRHVFQVVDENVEPEWTLLYYLRNKRILF